ncbi:hypothetical protein [Paraburkholderia sp. SIMBA_054]|uniref:hypothetical protein n=1 Tax=Paraburkholderia sp. SIMBA_054 TaxID=3085795 RepID=UPI003978959D
MKTGAILTIGIVLVAIVIAITVAIIAAAPYIAIGAVLLGVGYIAVTQDDEEPPGPSGPPAVQ